MVYPIPVAVPPTDSMMDTNANYCRSGPVSHRVRDFRPVVPKRKPEAQSRESNNNTQHTTAVGCKAVQHTDDT